MHINNISQKAAAFILHKPFHPGSYQTLEKVWIAEQKQAELERKQRQLQEARAQESKLDELRSALHKSRKQDSDQTLQWIADAADVEEAGLKLPKHLIEEISANKLDWLYINHSAASGSTGPALKPEDILKEKDNLTLPQQEDGAEQDLEALRSGQIAAAYRTKLSEADTMRKIREDPLFKIKQAELRHRKALEKNPLLARKRGNDLGLICENDELVQSDPKRYRVDHYKSLSGRGREAETSRSLRQEASSSPSPSPPRQMRKIGPVKPKSWDESEYLGPPPEMNESISRRLAGRATSLANGGSSDAQGRVVLGNVEEMQQAAAERQEKVERLVRACEARDRMEETRRKPPIGLVPKFLIDAQNEAIDRLVADRREAASSSSGGT